MIVKGGVMSKKQSVYEVITKVIVEKLEQGVIPWHKPWHCKGGGYPTNLISNKKYKGFNVMLLAMQGMESKYWASFKQIKSVGGNVKKGQKGSIVTYYKGLDIKDDAGEVVRTIPMLRYYTVFNLSQCENIDHKRLKEEQAKSENFEELDFNPIDEAERIVKGYKTAPEINHDGGNRAFYNRVHDMISMPEKSRFKSEQEYYSTLFHEMGHSTGHKSRLKRDTLENIVAFGDPVYSEEELIAEFTAAFLCGHCRIENVTIDNSASYIKGWAKKLKSNPKIIMKASSQGRKASEYILGAKGE